MNRSRTPRNWQQNRETSSVDALNRSIADLEARIEGLNARSRRPNVRADSMGTASEMVMRQRLLEREQRGRQAPPPPPPQRPRREAVPQQAAATQSAMRETSGAMRDIAEALVSLRDDLRHDISESMSREFGSLRRDVDEIKALSGTAATRPDVSQDLAHLADQLEMLETRRSESQGSALQAELDDLRAMVNELAREDSMRRLETRWDGFEEQISGMDPASIREDLITLSYRLDDIKSSIGQLPSALPLNALEDKIKMLVAAIDAMSRQPGASDPEVARQFAMLDERLDEISRAIVATSVSQPSGVDAADIQRLESRLDAVVDHIGQLSQADQSNELAHRIELLSSRVEDIAGDQTYGTLMDRLDALSDSLNEQPSSPDPHLIGQLEDISRKVDSLDLDTVNQHLADQLKSLSMRIDHVNGDLVATNSNQDMLYGRLENLAERVEESVAQQASMTLAPLEARLADIASRLDDSQSQLVPSDDAIRNLESQVAGLSQLLASPGVAGGANAELEPRLAAVEDHLLSGQGGNQDLVIETARQAAEAAVANFQQNGGTAADVSAIEALVADLRSLEDLSRKSEERNSRTIDAVHDTLMKIATRLERLEGSPETHRADPAGAEMMAAGSPDYAASSDPAFSDDAILPEGRDDSPGETSRDKPFLSGLVSRVKGSKGKARAGDVEAARRDIDAAPSIDPVADIDPETANMPLEPGSGAPDIKRIMAKVREAQTEAQDDNPYAEEADQARTDKADFIAAARRAARAAATEAADLEQAEEEDAKPGSLKETISRRRRPLLLAAGAILLAVLSYPLISGYMGGGQTPTQTAALEQSQEPQSPAVTEPVAGTDSDLPNVRVSETEVADDGGILVTRSTEATVTDNPPQMLSTSNEVQSSASFVPPDTMAGQTNPAQSEPAAPDNMQASVTPDAVDPAPSAMPESTLATTTIEMPPEAAGPLVLREAAANGDGLALFEIGARYTEGRGVSPDLREAAKWYQYAADLGFAPAQYRLANFYEKGTGLDRDLAKAKTWYQMAAEQGNASAMHNLAVLYAMGENGVGDYDSAGSWFTKAADLGVKDSQFNLAILHARGSGVTQDLEESYKWFAIAAQSGDKDAAKKRDEVANALRPEQLESARAKVELWKPAALVESANSVKIPPEWRGSETRTASVDMKKAVRNIQAILTKNGFDTGGVDGIMGNNTINAIKAFQTSVGLEPTGEVNDALVKELLARNN
ncbi:MAG: peptidoglycan-binding protein [Alphaproteobacteria bacterium]|nr:peptidoglycan-binding protein [Alphaproteobacteria bacterium]